MTPEQYRELHRKLYDRYVICTEHKAVAYLGFDTEVGQELIRIHLSKHPKHEVSTFSGNYVDSLLGQSFPDVTVVEPSFFRK